MSLLKNTKLRIFGGLTLLLALALIIGLSLYNTPHVDIHKAKADLAVMAEDVLKDYQSNETRANRKYVDRIL